MLVVGNSLKDFKNLRIFVDEDVFISDEHIVKGQIAILTICRTRNRDVYSFVETNWDRFSYVFTYDDLLLSTLPNAKIFIGGFYLCPESSGNKIKDVLVSNDYADTWKLQHIRSDISRTLKINKLADDKGGLKDYRYYVLIEDTLDTYNISNELCNCFISRTVPIYLGARCVDKVFDTRGIIFIDREYPYNNAIDTVSRLNYEKDYLDRADSVEYNFQIVKRNFNYKYSWFLRKYHSLLSDLDNECRLIQNLKEN